MVEYSIRNGVISTIWPVATGAPVGALTTPIVGGIVVLAGAVVAEIGTTVLIVSVEGASVPVVGDTISTEVGEAVEDDGDCSSVEGT